MKYSLLTAALILVMFAFVTIPRQQKIKTLTTNWEKLKTSATSLGVATDPQTRSLSIRSSSIRSSSDQKPPLDREESINELAAQFIALTQQMRETEKNGGRTPVDIRKGYLALMDSLNNMNLRDLTSLANTLSQDKTTDDELKRIMTWPCICIISYQNPEAALNFVIKPNNASLFHSKHIGDLLSKYAHKDPEKAAAWLTENTDSLNDDALKIKTILITTIAKKDFNSALSLVNTLALNVDSKIYKELAKQVTETDIDLFVKTLQSKNITQQQKGVVLSQLANSPFIQGDFNTATAWLDSSDIDRDSFIKNLDYKNIHENPDQWLNWIENQEIQGASNQTATRQILSQWAANDVTAAGKWILSKKDGTVKNLAVATYATMLTDQEPAAAAQWAASLPEGTERKNLLQKIYPSLYKKDPEAAAELAREYQLDTQ